MLISDVLIINKNKKLNFIFDNIEYSTYNLSYYYKL